MRRQHCLKLICGIAVQNLKTGNVGSPIQSLRVLRKWCKSGYSQTFRSRAAFKVSSVRPCIRIFNRTLQSTRKMQEGLYELKRFQQIPSGDYCIQTNYVMRSSHLFEYSGYLHPVLLSHEKRLQSYGAVDKKMREAGMEKTQIFW